MRREALFGSLWNATVEIVRRDGTSTFRSSPKPMTLRNARRWCAGTGNAVDLEFINRGNA